MTDVLKQWETHPVVRPPITQQRAFRTYLRHPAGLLKAVGARWPDPISATVTVNGSFNQWPRLPYQLGSIAVRAAKFLGGKSFVRVR